MNNCDFSRVFKFEIPLPHNNNWVFVYFFRAAIQAIAAYLDAFQKIADAATNSRGKCDRPKIEFDAIYVKETKT